MIFNPNVNSLKANASYWTILSVVLTLLCTGAAISLPGGLERGEDPVEAYTAFILCLAIGLPMILFALRRSMQLRRAAGHEAGAALTLGPEGLDYRHPDTPVSVTWSEIIDPLDAASHLRRRDGGASLLLIRKDAPALAKPVLRRLRKAHRLAILAPTCLPGVIHIPLRFLDARTPDKIRDEAARYWKAHTT